MVPKRRASDRRTGFIGAKLGVPHADPLTFLALRFVLATALLLALALATRAPWPRDPRQILHLCVAGVLLHAVYLGGVYVAMSLGVEEIGRASCREIVCQYW